ncbi:hypothetical protein DDZ14_11860 [Maritimibacter sp. 55A14]|uniref:H-type lectin domain-containing protein n=1 Tax=Maritimibacter sp. 55A14 TaxID=2174844 RepID=UPI000D60FD37|nr:H-type lectin domain-containing protein [Maritimibacter sp. 55A14]PWE32140.1 hypothetical protein DDZ14_11860 [Maritimibacter sp. 55A14]
MQRLRHHLIGLDRGSSILFSDYEHDGPMWTGTGPRELRTPIRFSGRFRAPPVVYVSIDMWDFDRGTNQRGDIQAESVTCEGFELVFRTWGDTRIARIRAAWQALGEVAGEDDWDLY